jgi:hypothetical protein
VASTDDIVKDKTDQHQGHVVKGGRRRHEGNAAEEDWKIDVFEETYSELHVQYPLEQWCKDPGKEEEDKAIVELTVRKQTLRPNDTPLQNNNISELRNTIGCANTTSLLTIIDALPNTVISGQVKPSF